ncbi:MAG: chromosome segregation protein SMC [Thermoanaerobaculaceae bacterium]
MSVRIASLALEGFKSFAGKVELLFPGDMVAIVGPNGAGKSNICDAIAWVLGEQSARTLRSQNMGEVIFAGSPQRPPAAAAQVTLVLKARNSQPDSQLEISRRLLRDGTSEYRLQGKRVRLKDIADKLAEAGLGTRAYAVIEQGRIAQVLSAKPTDRRALFEEAAGIGHFRLRRQEAELKLAETRANLERVADIVAEVRRELTSIRRQAKQAKRFSELREELKRTNQVVAWLKIRELQAQQEAVEAKLSQAREAAAQTATALAKLEAELLTAQRQWEEAAATLAQLQREHSNLEAMGQRLEVEEVALRRELERLRTREQQDKEALLHMQKQLEEEAAREEELTAKLAMAQREVEEATAAFERAAGAAEAVEAEAQKAEAQAEAARAELLRLVAAAAEARNQFHRLQVALEQVHYQQARLKNEQEQWRQNLKQVAAEEQQAAEVAKQCQMAVNRIQEQQRTLESALEEVRQKHAELARRRDELEHAHWQVHHELEAVQRTQSQLRALPDSLTTLLEDRLLAGTVADYLNPPPELVKLFDEAYKEMLLLPVVEGEEAAQKLLQRSTTGGVLEVAIRNPNCPGRPHPLLEAAGVTESERGWLSALLPPVVTVESPQEAEKLAQNPELLLLFPAKGLRQGQRLLLGDGKKAVAGALQLKKRERELSEEQSRLQKERERLAQELAQVAKAVGEKEQALAALHREARQAREALAEASSRYESRHRERVRLERELEAFRLEDARLREEEVTTQQQLSQAEHRAQKLEEQAAAASSRVDQQSAAAAASRETASRARTEVERARGNLLLASQRVQHLERELARHRQVRLQLQGQKEHMSGEISGLQASQTRTAELLATTRAKLEQVLEDTRLWATKITKAQEAVQTLKEGVGVAQEAVAEARSRDQEAQQAVHAWELRLAEVAGQKNQAVQEAFTPAPEPLPPAEMLPQLLAKQRELEQRLADLGPVNELALVQEQELTKRFRFLSEQEKDLKRSLASLQGSLRELDTTCKERFLATLEEANRHFGEVFRELFGGGEAYVVLSDPESPLDSGVEVRVRPPGKHTQSVLLLSGGEKALAALALLLALFRIRPAPFCVLDEVDAPLDDLNVERLCQHLRAQSATTQFLLITHNRRTMAYADVLYGVTMEEPGVSRVVSVRLENP